MTLDEIVRREIPTIGKGKSNGEKIVSQITEALRAARPSLVFPANLEGSKMAEICESALDEYTKNIERNLGIDITKGKS